MIQRVQSLFLLGIVILQVLMFIFPLWNAELNMSGHDLVLTSPNPVVGYMSGVYFYTAGKIKEEKSTGINIGMILINSIVAVASLLAIFMFRHRKRQIMIGNILSIPLILLPILGWFDSHSELQNANVLSKAFLPAFYFPLASLVLLVLAVRSIRADERLVRSADRLR